MKFIKLTSNATGRDLYFNPNHIISFYFDEKDVLLTTTEVSGGYDSSYSQSYNVKENCEQIAKLLEENE